MCDHEHYNKLDSRVDTLATRVDGIDDRLIKVETSLTDMRMECQRGFSNIDTQLKNIYAEKLKWGEWARGSLSAIGHWLSRWGTIILLASLGVAWGMSWAKEFLK